MLICLSNPNAVNPSLQTGPLPAPANRRGKEVERDVWDESRTYSLKLSRSLQGAPSTWYSTWSKRRQLRKAFSLLGLSTQMFLQGELCSDSSTYGLSPLLIRTSSFHSCRLFYITQTHTTALVYICPGANAVTRVLAHDLVDTYRCVGGGDSGGRGVFEARGRLLLAFVFNPSRDLRGVPWDWTLSDPPRWVI